MRSISHPLNGLQTEIRQSQVLMGHRGMEKLVGVLAISIPWEESCTHGPQTARALEGLWVLVCSSNSCLQQGSREAVPGVAGVSSPLPRRRFPIPPTPKNTENLPSPHEGGGVWAWGEVSASPTVMGIFHSLTSTPVSLRMGSPCPLSFPVWGEPICVMTQVTLEAPRLAAGSPGPLAVGSQLPCRMDTQVVP